VLLTASISIWRNKVNESGAAVETLSDLKIYNLFIMPTHHANSKLEILKSFNPLQFTLLILFPELNKFSFVLVPENKD
jgi:hypothetical protein